MPMQTEQEYYESESNWGGYAYTTLKEVIDEILLETIDTDNNLAGTRRSLLLARAKNGIQELSRSVKKTILAAEITVGPKLWMPLPQNYMDWVRVSVLDSDFKLHPLKSNNNIHTAVGYLQDNDYELLFDNNGSILMADSSNIYNKTYHKYNFCTGTGGNENGEFVIDDNRGTIGFSSNLEDKEIVIEYISDGLDMQVLSEQEISIHKSLKQVLMAYVYSEIIRKRRSPRLQDKKDALDRYKALLHRAKLDNLSFNIVELNNQVEVTATGSDSETNTTVINTSSGDGWFSNGF